MIFLYVILVFLVLLAVPVVAFVLAFRGRAKIVHEQELPGGAGIVRDGIVFFGVNPKW